MCPLFIALAFISADKQNKFNASVNTCVLRACVRPFVCVSY